MFTDFQQIFRATANKLNISRQLDASLICNYAKIYLDTNLPTHSEIKVVYFKNKNLLITVPHPATGLLLNSHRLKIIDFINTKTGKKTVEKIIIKPSEQDNATIA